jgi:hypothetical protein
MDSIWQFIDHADTLDRVVLVTAHFDDGFHGIAPAQHDPPLVLAEIGPRSNEQVDHRAPVGEPLLQDEVVDTVDVIPRDAAGET